MAREPNSASLLPPGLLRFSIRHLLLWTAAIALGCVALRSASSGWVAAMLALTTLVLATAVLLAVFRQGADRAHWVGFAAFGWLYLLLLMFGWSGSSSDLGSWENPFLPYNLATAKLSAWCYDRLYAPPEVEYTTGGMSGFSSMSGFDGGGPTMGMGKMPSGMGPMGGMPGGGGAPAFDGPAQGDFVNVAHSLWALLLAACGGWLARWLYATGPGAKKEPADRTSPQAP